MTETETSKLAVINYCLYFTVWCNLQVSCQSTLWVFVLLYGHFRRLYAIKSVFSLFFSLFKYLSVDLQIYWVGYFRIFVIRTGRNKKSNGYRDPVFSRKDFLFGCILRKGPSFIFKRYFRVTNMVSGKKLKTCDALRCNFQLSFLYTPFLVARIYGFYIANTLSLF